MALDLLLIDPIGAPLVSGPELRKPLASKTEFPVAIRHDYSALRIIREDIVRW